MDDTFPAGMVEEIERFLATDHLRRVGDDLYSEVFDTGLFFPLQRQRELAEMIRQARIFKPATVMEIGADKGGGLYHWVKCLPSVQRVIACEIRGTPYDRAFERAFPEIDFLWIAASSYAEITVRTVQTWLKHQLIDCLFIDGDKSEFALDFTSYLPLMNPCGVVFMHDIQDAKPGADYWATIARGGYEHREIVNIEDSIEAAVRESRGYKARTPHEQWLRHWRGKSAGVGVIYLGGKDS